MSGVVGILGVLGLLGEEKRRPDRKMPGLRGFFVAWEADALPTELFPLNDLRGPYLDWGPNRGRTLALYTDAIALHGKYGQRAKPRQCSQMSRFQEVTREDGWSLGS